jgi:choline-sulfatase
LIDLRAAKTLEILSEAGDQIVQQAGRAAGNLLFIISDEHQARALSCAGHPIVRTPHIDALAERGNRFEAAYTPCPICVPARASLATGRYVHDIRYWDNATAYDGRVPGWGVRLQAANVRMEAIGKLHYRNREDPTGFDAQHRPMHIWNGIGQVWGSVRDPIPGPRDDIVRFEQLGAGYSKYNAYDEAVRDQAIAWIRNHANDKRPWMLFVGFVAPHFPLIAPQFYIERYPPDQMPLPALRRRGGYSRHPWVDAQERLMPTDAEFGMDDAKRRRAISAYFALCTMLDDHVGAICAALGGAGLAETTTVIYTSDHGEALGQRDHWGKSNLYSECTQVPLVVAGPDAPRGHGCKTPVNLIDLAPTFLAAFGLSDPQLPGRSLFDVAREPFDSNRAVFSEYHAVGAPSGAFMLRKGRWKYHEYIGFEPELFDLESDPDEATNVANDPGCAAHVVRLRKELRRIVDPEAADRQAKTDQRALVEGFGGREAAFRMGTEGPTPAPNA